MQEKIIKDEFSEFSGIRIDIFLHKQYSDMSRSAIQEKMKKGLVLLNDRTIKSSYRLEPNDRITMLDAFFEYEKQDLSVIKKYELDLDIVFEDKDILIVNKPAGISSHPSKFDNEKTLVNALVNKFSQDDLSDHAGPDRLGIVHRLDKETSGLMVVAKNNEMHAKLSDLLKEKTDFKRKYLAICYGVPTPASGTIEKYMKKGSFLDKRMVLCDEDDATARFSKTHYKVLKTFLNGEISLIEFELDTGRTHQIRLHICSIGHGIVGDKVYVYRKNLVSSKDLRERIAVLPGQMLCSYYLSLVHPKTGKFSEFQIEMPEAMLNLLESLKKI